MQSFGGKPASNASQVVLRTELQRGDVEAIVRFHCEAYEREFGFDPTFEAHESEPLAAFARSSSPRQCVWIAEADRAMVGCIAIVEASERQAQLRWFLVTAAARNSGLGRRLLREAIEFSRSAGYETMFLWTVNVLEAAAHLYREFGFEIVESNPGRLWGVDLVEERYELRFS
jgi:N-acetylglutamate synthase-like GNAT family acetyltransferase